VSEARDSRHLHVVRPIEPQAAAVESGPDGLPVSGMAERDLARKLAHVKLVSIDAAIWRHVSPREQSRPDSGDGAIGTGGRFNPPRSFPVVYGSLSRAGAGAEFRIMARRHRIDIDYLLPRHLYRFRIKSGRVLDLRLSEVRQTLGLPQMGAAAIHLAHSQLIGELARALGIDVIVAPGAAEGIAMAAIFPELIPGYKREFRHMAIWMTIADVPGTADLKPNIRTDSHVTMLQTVQNLSSLSMGGNPQ
jgi:RES domain-containing protein